MPSFFNFVAVVVFVVATVVADLAGVVATVAFFSVVVFTTSFFGVEGTVVVTDFTFVFTGADWAMPARLKPRRKRNNNCRFMELFFGFTKFIPR